MNEITDQERLARVLEVIDERGYVACEDLAQLTESGPSIINRLSVQLGIEASEVRGLAEQRKISPEAVRALLERG